MADVLVDPRIDREWSTLRGLIRSRFGGAAVLLSATSMDVNGAWVYDVRYRIGVMRYRARVSIAFDEPIIDDGSAR